MVPASLQGHSTAWWSRKHDSAVRLHLSERLGHDHRLGIRGRRRRFVACSDCKEGQHLLEHIQGLYEWGTWESKSFTQCGGKITQAYDGHLKQWGGLAVSYEDYAQEVPLINLTAARRSQSEHKVTAYEQTLFRGISGQLS